MFCFEYVLRIFISSTDFLPSYIVNIMVTEDNQRDTDQAVWEVLSKSSKYFLGVELSNFQSCTECLRQFIDSKANEAIFIIDQGDDKCM